jgi:hypothetical protein
VALPFDTTSHTALVLKASFFDVQVNVYGMKFGRTATSHAEVGKSIKSTVLAHASHNGLERLAKT